jgi:fibronectin type 3 domain-containing protein
MKRFRNILFLPLLPCATLLFCGEPSTAVAPAVSPAPLIVTAEGFSMSTIRVTWVTISIVKPYNVNSYNVYRSTGDPGTYTLIGTRPDPTDTLTDTGLVPGSIFYYKVSATNSVGESELSKSASSSTAIPGNVATRVVSGLKISLTWSSVLGATSYNVYKDTSDSGTFSIAANIVKDTFVDSGLALGTTYWYTITAKNDSGESKKSALKNAITMPAVPVQLSAVGISSSGIRVVWPAVKGAATYRVFRSQIDTAAYPVVDTVSTDTLIDNTLSPYSRYFYKINAVNSSGVSDTSDSAWAITFPGTPTGVFAASDSAGKSIFVTWRSMAGASLYIVYKDTVDTGAFTSADTVFTDTFVDTGIVVGKTYYYKVSAADSLGASVPSTPVSATVLKIGLAPAIREMEWCFVTEEDRRVLTIHPLVSRPEGI